jgi:hypothetical protein
MSMRVTDIGDLPRIGRVASLNTLLGTQLGAKSGLENRVRLGYF